jgi:hypothetical protein
LFSMHWKVFNSLPCSLELQLCDLHVLCPFLGCITRAGNLLEVKLPCPRWCAAFSSGPRISIQKGSIGWHISGMHMGNYNSLYLFVEEQSLNGFGINKA